MLVFDGSSVTWNEGAQPLLLPTGATAQITPELALSTPGFSWIFAVMADHRPATTTATTVRGQALLLLHRRPGAAQQGGALADGVQQRKRKDITIMVSRSVFMFLQDVLLK
jgi:hypothetical protein